MAELYKGTWCTRCQITEELFGRRCGRHITDDELEAYRQRRLDKLVRPIR